MIFECDGEFVDTDKMFCPSLNDPYAVGIYITKDYSRVFGAFIHGEEGVRIERVQGELLEMIAQRTGARALVAACELQKSRSPA